MSPVLSPNKPAEAGLFGAAIYSRRIMEKVQRLNDEDGALPAALFSHKP